LGRPASRRGARAFHVTVVERVFDLFERVVEPIFGRLGHGPGSIAQSAAVGDRRKIVNRQGAEDAKGT
jgi:hypothetical protein